MKMPGKFTLLQSWQPIETAPKDGTLLILLIHQVPNFGGSNNPTENELIYRTIGHNNFDDTGEDAWEFAGWCWSHDHWVQGSGTPIQWMPMPKAPEMPVGADTDRVVEVDPH